MRFFTDGVSGGYIRLACQPIVVHASHNAMCPNSTNTVTSCLHSGYPFSWRLSSSFLYARCYANDRCKLSTITAVDSATPPLSHDVLPKTPSAQKIDPGQFSTKRKKKYMQRIFSHIRRSHRTLHKLMCATATDRALAPHDIAV